MLQAQSIIIALLILLSAPLLRSAEPAYDLSPASLAKERDLSVYDFPYSRAMSVPVSGSLNVNRPLLHISCTPAISIFRGFNSGSCKTFSTPLLSSWQDIAMAGNSWSNDRYMYHHFLQSYAGTALYMSARGSGLSSWRSFLYNVAMSTFLMQYESETLKESPSVRNMLLTPMVGAVVGECFYRAKRNIVSHGYEVLGSPVLGYIAAFIMDPVNEVSGYLRKEEECPLHADIERQRKGAECNISSCFWVHPGGLNPGGGIKVTYHF